MYPGVILLFNMTDYHKYCFLISDDSQHYGPGKQQRLLPQFTDLERQHTRSNKLFSVICHRNSSAHSFLLPSGWEMILWACGCCC